MADGISRDAGVEKCFSLPFLLGLCIVAFFWLRRNKYFEKFGICKPCLSPKQMLFYIPLVIMASCNLWFGVQCNYSPVETVLYIGSMICVGFLEELIFRGFLFHAIREDSLKAAVVVSAVTFGIGHVVNLVNGSGAELIPNLLQICYAMAAGFLFVVIYIKTNSLLPCIITHCVLNSLSAFSVTQDNMRQIFVASALCVIPGLYILYLVKRNTEAARENSKTRA